MWSWYGSESRRVSHLLLLPGGDTGRGGEVTSEDQPHKADDPVKVVRHVGEEVEGEDGADRGWEGHHLRDGLESLR